MHESSACLLVKNSHQCDWTHLPEKGKNEEGSNNHRNIDADPNLTVFVCNCIKSLSTAWHLHRRSFTPGIQQSLAASCGLFVIKRHRLTCFPRIDAAHHGSCINITDYDSFIDGTHHATKRADSVAHDDWVGRRSVLSRADLARGDDCCGVPQLSVMACNPAEAKVISKF